MRQQKPTSICYFSKLLHGRKLLSNGNNKEKREGFMVSPVLHVGLLRQERKGESGTKEEQRRRREKERDGKGLVTAAVYIEEN
jgi:hypothetical protein